MHTRQWTVRWADADGPPQEYRFTTDDNRVLAGIDFRMRLIEQGKPVPQNFTLEEGRKVMQVVPSLRELEDRA